MIDNAAQVERLIERMQAELPLAARMTPELMASLAKQTAAVAAPCKIMSIRYTGDEGGILCQLELSQPIKNAVYASITHLRFDPKQPLTRAITATQGKPSKRARNLKPQKGFSKGWINSAYV
jgi:hypothetical protein